MAVLRASSARDFSVQRRRLLDRARPWARREPMLLVFMAGALAARIAFWVISNRAFEDGLTTITHARNVALGLGLVHHPGEGNVYGFTSALGVLIPLAGELIREGSGLFAIRIASLAAVCVALVYARLICRDLGLGTFPTAFVLAYLAFDQNMIFYGMAGMETQVAVAVILGGVFHVRRHDLVASGICLGLAPLARPEFVLWVAPALAYLALRNAKRAAQAAAVAGAIVVPWVVFTFLYYGSPIPNTVIAKSAVNPIPPVFADGSPLAWIQWLAGHFVGQIALLLYHLEPFREVWSTAAAPLPDPLLTVIAVIIADLVVIGLLVSRGIPGFWPVTAFLALFFAYRVYFLPVAFYYDWYLPPFLAVVMIVAALGLQRVTAVEPKTSKAIATVLAVAFSIHMPFSFVVEAKVQAIEDQVRTNVGKDLRATVQPGQSVVSESAGYVGFYGNVKLYDYPGLTSPTSVHALQKLPPAKRDLFDLIVALQPDWIVLRPRELVSLRQRFPETASMYAVDRVFEMAAVPGSQPTDDAAATTVSFAGLVEWNVDEKFIVLKRTPPRGG
ncbi:MAG TPA: hypothetical protein VIJ58_09575 [Candidatus Dormibacteraeota bacterium]